jgi:hypothetical protein
VLSPGRFAPGPNGRKTSQSRFAHLFELGLRACQYAFELTLWHNNCFFKLTTYHRAIRLDTHPPVSYRPCANGTECPESKHHDQKQVDSDVNPCIGGVFRARASGTCRSWPTRQERCCWRLDWRSSAGHHRWLSERKKPPQLRRRRLRSSPFILSSLSELPTTVSRMRPR